VGSKSCSFFKVKRFTDEIHRISRISGVVACAALLWPMLRLRYSLMRSVQRAHWRHRWQVDLVNAYRCENARKGTTMEEVMVREREVAMSMAMVSLWESCFCLSLRLRGEVGCPRPDAEDSRNPDRRPWTSPKQKSRRLHRRKRDR
jgi:hypothetical protein